MFTQMLHMLNTLARRVSEPEQASGRRVKHCQGRQMHSHASTVHGEGQHGQRRRRRRRLDRGYMLIVSK